MPELILTLKGRELKKLGINKPELTIGRDPDDDLFIDNIGISRSHAKVRVTAQGDLFVMDNQSSNGTFVNGEQVQGRHKLSLGDEIQMAKYVITYSPTGPALDLHKLREKARGGTSTSKDKGAGAGPGTLTFSAEEIKSLVAKNEAKAQAAPQPQEDLPKDPLERLLHEEEQKQKQKRAAQRAQLPAQSGGNQNQLVVLGLIIVILLLVLILLLLLRS